MSVSVKELLTENVFIENFNNTTTCKKTLALFSLKRENNSLWKIWGYGFNDPGNDHAEVLVLKTIEEYITEKQTSGKYNVTLFLSHTPCHECSDRIISFFTSRNGIQVEIKASKPYFLMNEDEQNGLWNLKKAGIPIKMMDKSDYQKCFYLFVHPSKKFTPWPGLDDQSKKNLDVLNTIWKQKEDGREEKGREEKIRKRIKTSHHYNVIDSHSFSGFPMLQNSAQEISKPGILLDAQSQSPVMERTQLSEPETPQKLNYPTRGTEACPAVKRKLDFSKN